MAAQRIGYVWRTKLPTRTETTAHEFVRRLGCGYRDVNGNVRSFDAADAGLRHPYVTTPVDAWVVASITARVGVTIR